jgi:hypothetical protein
VRVRKRVRVSVRVRDQGLWSSKIEDERGHGSEFCQKSGTFEYLFVGRSGTNWVGMR